MSGLVRDHFQRTNLDNLKGKEVGMETVDESESDIRNEEDVQDANIHSGNDGDLGDSMSEDEWEDATCNFEMTETAPPSVSVLEGSNQKSQSQTTEGAVGGSQQKSQSQTTEDGVGGSQQKPQSQTTKDGVGGSQQKSQSQTTEGAVGGSQQKSQSQAREGAVGGSQQKSQSQMTEGAVGGSQQKYQSQMTEGAVGGSQQKSQSQMTEGAAGGSQQKSQSQTTGAAGACSESGSSMSEGAVGGWQQKSRAIAQAFQPLFPSKVKRSADPSEEFLQSKFIKQVTIYEGAPIAPSEDFELQWTVLQDELEVYLTGGMLPPDTVASAGVDEESYKHMQLCAETLQDQLFEGNLLRCLGTLRGFRRIFSRSEEPYLRHAFRGNPLEVLQNIYYGGEGILPEDRMQLDDPFHYTKNPDDMEN